MPHIRMSGLDVPRVKALSAHLSQDLSKTIGCPIDWITFSVGNFGDGNIFCDGKIVRDTVFVHVEWFDRGSEVKDTVARIITDGIFETKRCKFSEIETVDVIFVDLKKEDYYENGQHY